MGGGAEVVCAGWVMVPRTNQCYAASVEQRKNPINSLVAECLEQRVARDGRMRLAADRILAVADQGPLTSEDPGKIRREEIYERG